MEHRLKQMESWLLPTNLAPIVIVADADLSQAAWDELHAAEGAGDWQQWADLMERHTGCRPGGGERGMPVHWAGSPMVIIIGQRPDGPQ